MWFVVLLSEIEVFYCLSFRAQPLHSDVTALIGENSLTVPVPSLLGTLLAEVRHLVIMKRRREVVLA